MSFSTPKIGFSNISASSFQLKPPSYPATDSLEKILGIEHINFRELTPYKKSEAALALYHVLSNKTHSLEKLQRSEDAYDILLYAVNSNFSSILIKPKPKQVYKVIIGAINKCNLS